MSQNSTLSRDTGEATTITPPGKVSIVLNYSNRSLLSKSHVLNSILLYKDTIAYREQEMKEGMARYLDVLIRNSNLPCVKPCQHGMKIREDQNKCHLEEVWFPFASTSASFRDRWMSLAANVKSSMILSQYFGAKKLCGP